MSLHFYFHFTLVCGFLSPKFTFFHFFHYRVTFFHLNLNFLIKFFFSKSDLNVSGLVKFDPRRASSYLPKKLNTKWRCLNIQNNDEKCFPRSILALLHPVQHRNYLDRVKKYQEYESELNMSGVKYPIDIKILTNLNTKTTLVLISMDVKIKNLPVIYYYHEHCKTLRKFTIYYCLWNISLRFSERLEQIDIKTK